MPKFVEIVIGALNSIFDMTILMIYLKCILQHRREWINCFVYYIGFIVICGIQYSIGWFTNSWLINMMASLLGIFILTFIYDNKMLTRIFAPVSFQVFAMLSELLCYIIIQFLQNKHFIISDSDGTLYANSLSRLILLIIVIFIASLVKNNTAMLFMKDYLFMLITPIVSIVIIFAIAFQFEYESESINSRISVCFSVAGIMIINFIVYYLLENLITATEIREKQLKMETQFDYQEKKYEQTSQSFKNISGIIHDTNKHLIYLRECIMQKQNEEAVVYINKAIDAIDKSYKRFNTGNLVIDALVSNVANVAFVNRITFKTDIRIDKEKINIERYDLSIVLGNLLDNSIEACMEILNPDDRYLKITIITADMALIIDISNSALRRKDIFRGLTNKPDKLRHGYGIKNISMIADKYGGTFCYGQKESTFEASVILPLRDG